MQLKLFFVVFVLGGRNSKQFSSSLRQERKVQRGRTFVQESLGDTRKGKKLFTGVLSSDGIKRNHKYHLWLITTHSSNAINQSMHEVNTEGNPCQT